MSKVISLILCGGLSKRLWPMSKPKQFSCLYNSHNLLENTINRSKAYSQQYQFVTNKLYIEDVKTAVESTGISNVEIFAEPQSRNTASAVFTTLLYNTEVSALDDIIIISPSDHLVEDQAAYDKNIIQAIQCAEDGYIALIGIQPNSANTQFGYIEVDKQFDQGPYFAVNNFHEKPSAIKAKEYFESNHYFWNSGIYVFKRKTLLNELSKIDGQLTEIYQQAASNVTTEEDCIYFNNSEYGLCPDISIDKLISEKSNKIQMVQSEFFWKDLGSWETLSDIQELDQNNNYNDCNAELIAVNNTYVSSNSNKKIVIDGVSDLIVIETENGLLIKRNNKINDSVSNLTPITTNLKQKMNKKIT